MGFRKVILHFIVFMYKLNTVIIYGFILFMKLPIDTDRSSNRIHQMKKVNLQNETNQSTRKTKSL